MVSQVHRQSAVVGLRSLRPLSLLPPSTMAQWSPAGVTVGLSPIPTRLSLNSPGSAFYRKQNYLATCVHMTTRVEVLNPLATKTS